VEKGYQSLARSCIVGRPHPRAVGLLSQQALGARSDASVRMVHIFAYAQCSVQEHKHENRPQGIPYGVEVACADQRLQEHKRCRKRNT
jgi:hypothetical protein